MIPNFIDMLSELVATPSVSSTVAERDMGNRPVIDTLASWLEDLGFDCRVMPLEKQPHKANLLAVLGSGPGGLVLSGHTDTVPFDEHLWQQDPLKLTERDHRLYGIGSTDMKGFFPVAITAAKTFADKKLKAPLMILATADEESSMDGARQLVKADLQGARYALIGEPTGLKPIHMHKGMMMESITIEGRSGHSSNPLLGNSALEAMTESLLVLRRLRAEWQEKYVNPAFEVSVPTMNLGCIHGGDNPNRICGECELHFDVRPMPGMTLEPIRKAIRAKLKPIAEARKIDISLRSLMVGVEPFEEPIDSELCRLVETFSGKDCSTVAFATEAPFLQKLGMQTIVMGPGSIDVAHQPNEYLPMDQIDPALEFLSKLIGKLCLKTPSTR